MERTPLYEIRDTAHNLAMRELAPIYALQALGVAWSFYAIATFFTDPHLRSFLGAMLITTIVVTCYLSMLSCGYRGTHIRFYHDWFDINYENTAYEAIDVVAIFSTYTHTGTMRMRTPFWARLIWFLALALAPLFPALLVYLLSETPTVRTVLARFYNRLHFGIHPTGDALLLSWPIKSTLFALQRDTLVIPLHIAQENKAFLDFIWDKVLDRFETIPEFESVPPIEWFATPSTAQTPKSSPSSFSRET